MDIVTWVVLGVFCMLAGLWLWCGVGQRRGRRLDDGTLVERVGLTAQPVLSREELEWYNLIRLAVQDRYLVLSQVPLWVLVTMRGGNRSERATLMGRLALKRVGFVLLHPGTGEIYRAIDIGIQQRLQPTEPSHEQGQIDALLDLVEEIVDHLRFERLVDFPEAAWAGIEHEPVVATEHLDQHRQFTSILTVTYRVLR